MKTSLGGFNLQLKAQVLRSADSLRGHCRCTSPTATVTSPTRSMLQRNRNLREPGLDNIGNVATTLPRPGFFTTTSDHQSVHRLGPRRHQVPHGCVQRIQPHHPGNPGSDIESEGDITGRDWRQFSYLDLTSRSVLTREGTATSTRGSFGSPRSFHPNDLSSKPGKRFALARTKLKAGF